MMVEGMGHDLPRDAVAELIDAIAEHARAADTAAGVAAVTDGQRDPSLRAAPILVGARRDRFPSRPRWLPTAAGCRSRSPLSVWVRALAHQDGSRLDAHEPVVVVPAVRAAVRPASVQAAHHAALVAGRKPSPPCPQRPSAAHRDRATIPIPSNQPLLVLCPPVKARHINHDLRRLST